MNLTRAKFDASMTAAKRTATQGPLKISADEERAANAHKATALISPFYGKQITEIPLEVAQSLTAEFRAYLPQALLDQIKVKTPLLHYLPLPIEVTAC